MKTLFKSKPKNIIFGLSFMLALLFGGALSFEKDHQKAVADDVLPSNYVANPLQVDKSKLYGICDLSYTEVNKGVDLKKSHRLIKELGCTTVRVNLQATWMMSNPKTFNDSGLQRATKIVDSLAKDGHQIIGVNHTNFHPVDGVNSLSGKPASGKPRRDLTEGSYYRNWLDDYETTWYTLVSHFPKVQYWEIDNEPNGNGFFSPIDDGANYTIYEKAAIFTDMLFYASHGIHRANENAVTVMGGLVINGADEFLGMIYDNIADNTRTSHEPDDYFQVAAWHPYMQTNFTKTKFINDNNTVYNVIHTRENGDKKVFFTEFGTSAYYKPSMSDRETILREAYEAAYDFPYLESMCFFRLYDSKFESNSAISSTYGLFEDPLTDQEGIEKGAPKSIAAVYQEIAGGSGSLSYWTSSFEDDCISYRMDAILANTYNNRYDMVNDDYVDYAMMHGDMAGDGFKEFDDGNNSQLKYKNNVYAYKSQLITRKLSGKREGIIFVFKAKAQIRIESNRCRHDSTQGNGMWFNVWKKEFGSSSYTSLYSNLMTDAESKLNNSYVVGEDNENNGFVLYPGDYICYELILDSSLADGSTRNLKASDGSSSYLNFDVYPDEEYKAAFDWSDSFVNNDLCDNGVTPPSVTEWSNYKGTYNSLSFGSRQIIKTYRASDIPNSLISSALEKYYYIINKYGSSTYEDYIEATNLNQSSLLIPVIESEEDYLPVTIILISVSLCIMAIMVFIKKDVRE